MLMIEVLGIGKDTSALHWPGACLPPAGIAMACLLVPPLSSVNSSTSNIHLRLQHKLRLQLKLKFKLQLKLKVLQKDKTCHTLFCLPWIRTKETSSFFTLAYNAPAPLFLEESLVQGSLMGEGVTSWETCSLQGQCGSGVSLQTCCDHPQHYATPHYRLGGAHQFLPITVLSDSSILPSDS